MNIILVDDDPAALRLLAGFCSMVDDIVVTGSFTSAREAIEFAKQTPPQAAILDIIMPEVDGIHLTDCLLAINPDLLVFYTTASREYALSAFQRNAVSYLLKPFSFSDIQKALNRAKLLCKPDTPHLFARTFGHFDIFLEGTALSFPRKKCKEMLAYLIDRNGGFVSMEQMIDVLWEDRSYDESVRSYIHVIARDLKKTLRDAGISDLLICRRAQIAVNPSAFSCDYYDYLNGNPAALSAFHGEYMSDYSWAEPTVALLTEQSRQEF